MSLLGGHWTVVLTGVWETETGVPRLGKVALEEALLLDAVGVEVERFPAEAAAGTTDSGLFVVIIPDLSLRSEIIPNDNEHNVQQPVSKFKFLLNNDEVTQRNYKGYCNN